MSKSSAGGAPPLLVDVTTLLAEAGRIAHGTTRVERGIVGALLAIEPPGLVPCRFDLLNHRFIEVGRTAARSALDRVTVTEARREALHSPATSRVATLGKGIEASVRRNAGTPLRRAGARLMTRVFPPSLPAQCTFLNFGEMRFDLALLAELARHSRSKVVLTMFDVLPIGFVGKADPTRIERAMLDAFDTIFRMADLFLCISEVTASEVARYAKLRGLGQPPTVVIPLANTLTMAPSHSTTDPSLEPGRFVLAVGDMVPRKNHAHLVRTWRSLIARHGPGTPILVIAGRVSEECAALAREIRTDPLLAERIRIVANADDTTLAWLYANCRFTVFASLAEGYGLPVGESLAAGKPCVASSAGAIPEAAQGQAILLPPTDEAAWREAVSRLIEDVEALAEAERRIAREFRRVTWRDTAQFVLDVLAERGLLPSGGG